MPRKGRGMLEYSNFSRIAANSTMAKSQPSPEPRPYTPGMNGPIVCERPDGSVDYIFTDRNMNAMQGGFEPQGQIHQNHINAFSTDSMEQKQMRESQYQDMPFDQVMNPPMYSNMGFQPSQFTYDQFGNAIPMMQPSQFAYDQFGNMIPAQPQMMGNPYDCFIFTRFKNSS